MVMFSGTDGYLKYLRVLLGSLNLPLLVDSGPPLSTRDLPRQVVRASPSLIERLRNTFRATRGPVLISVDRTHTQMILGLNTLSSRRKYSTLPTATSHMQSLQISLRIIAVLPSMPTDLPRNPRAPGFLPFLFSSFGRANIVISNDSALIGSGLSNNPLSNAAPQRT